VILLFGGQLIDKYVDWLWFGEMGYRSVFTTVLVTRLTIGLVAGLLMGAVVFSALALAYRTRPVFVPTAGPNDPVARYRTTVMSRLKLFGIGIPAAIGFFAFLFVQGEWVTVQMFLHGGDFGDARKRDLRQQPVSDRCALLDGAVRQRVDFAEDLELRVTGERQRRGREHEQQMR